MALQLLGISYDLKDPYYFKSTWHGSILHFLIKVCFFMMSQNISIGVDTWTNKTFITNYGNFSSEQFNFHRPKAPDRETLSAAFMSHQAQYMKKVLAEKEKEMKLLQGQLNKFNAETFRLLKELEG